MNLIDANLSNVKKVDKPWGYEIWMANNEANDYCGKILFIKKGFESSLHFHYEKAETLYVQSGLLKVKLIDTQKGEEHEYDHSGGRGGKGCEQLRLVGRRENGRRARER